MTHYAEPPITEAMIHAGISAYLSWSVEISPEREAVQAIYRAMQALEPNRTGRLLRSGGQKSIQAQDLESRLIRGLSEGPKIDPGTLGQRLASCLPASCKGHAEAPHEPLVSSLSARFLVHVRSWFSFPWSMPGMNPNPRWNALRLGISLILASASPYFRTPGGDPEKVRWQPADPHGWPSWFPLGVFRGRPIDQDEFRMMRLVATRGARLEKPEP